MRQTFPFSNGPLAQQPPRPRGAVGDHRLVVEHVEAPVAIAGAVAIRRLPSWLRVGAIVAATPRLVNQESGQQVLFDVRGAVEVRGEGTTYYIVPNDAVQTELTGTSIVRPRGVLR